jgi:hypothetical protein
MEWMPYQNGELAKCKHGHYFIYKKFGEQAGEEACRDCDENANVMTKVLNS